MKRILMLSLALAIPSASLLSTSADEEKDLPIQLQSLVDSYEREKARVMDPVDRKFDTALIELQRYFTKAGRLEDALAVNKVIESRGGDSAAPAPSYGNTRWKWGSGGVLELKRNGDAMHTSWTKAGEWEELSDGTLQLTSQHGVSTLEFSDESTGTVTSEKGGRTTLTRIE